MQRVVITGGTGFIGRKLAKELIARGDQPVILSRDAARAQKQVPSGALAAAWDPEREGPWFDEIAKADAIIHLAGENVAKRWTADARRAIEQSRIDTTRLIVDAIARAPKKPRVLVNASAVGYYGAQPPDRELDESSPAGTGFLADICVRWEEAARAAEQHGVRSVQVRIGVVLGEGGGPLEKMILPFKLFTGGPIGAGTQVIPWVHADDVVGILLLALDDERVRGPINAVSPNPANSNELARALGQVMHRPSWFRTPAFVLEAAMGEAAMIVTEGQRVRPRKALELGYSFRRADLVPALQSILGGA